MVAKTEELFKLLWTCAYLRMTIYFALSGNRADTAGDIFPTDLLPTYDAFGGKTFQSVCCSQMHWVAAVEY